MPSGASPLLLDNNRTRALDSARLIRTVAVKLSIALKTQSAATTALKLEGTIAAIDIEVNTARVIAILRYGREPRADIWGAVGTTEKSYKKFT